MFKFTEEQVMIRDMVREFTKNEVEPRTASCGLPSQSRFSPSICREAQPHFW